jgi:hypothetical protein
MGYQVKIVKNDEPLLGHLRFKTVLTGIAIIALGAYYQAEQQGLLSMYLDADTLSKLTMVAGVLVWYFRVKGYKTDSAGRLTAEDIAKIKEENRKEFEAELVAKNAPPSDNGGTLP